MTLSPEETLQAIQAEVTLMTPTSRPAPLVLRTFSSHEFTRMALKPRQYVLEPILRTGGIGMLAAYRGVGKTQVAVGIAHAVASGGRFLKWQAPTPRPVLYVDGEMPGADLQERLRMFPSITSGLLRILPLDEQELGVSLNLAQREHQERLESVLGPAELLILDNRSTLVSGGRENEAESWDSMQAWLLKLRRRGVTVLLVEHEGRGGNPRGTSKREDILDTLINLKRPNDYMVEEGARFEVHLGKARGVVGEAAKPFEAKLEVRNDQAIWTVRDLSAAEADQVMALSGHDMSVREIAEATGISKSKVSRIQTALRANGKL